MNAIATAMRLAFEKATANVPTKKRTRLYAMTKSALARRVGLTESRKRGRV